MAKTNKTSKKTSNSKKSRFSFLNPNTAKKRLLMILLIFAVIGGGVLAYRSYAATGYGDYTVYQFQSSNGAYLANAPGAKRDYKVLWLPGGSSVELAFQFQPIIFAPRVRACVYVSQEIPSSSVYGDVLVTERGIPIGQGYYSFNSTGFKKICTKFGTHNDPDSRLGIEIFNNSGSNQVLVSGGSLEYSN